MVPTGTEPGSGTPGNQLHFTNLAEQPFQVSALSVKQDGDTRTINLKDYFEEIMLCECACKLSGNSQT